jgi:hypothetical protein
VQRFFSIAGSPGNIACALPQGRPGIAEKFVADLREGVEYAKTPPDSPAKSGAIYGGGTMKLDPKMVNDLMLSVVDSWYVA